MSGQSQAFPNPSVRACVSISNSWFESIWHEPLRQTTSRAANVTNPTNQVRKAANPAGQSHGLNEGVDDAPETVETANNSSPTNHTPETDHAANQVADKATQSATVNSANKESQVTTARQSSDEHEVAAGPAWDDEAWCGANAMHKYDMNTLRVG